ncbi:MAG: hypothetical protein GX817_03195 [Elusimicrobia bacterium]|nr:hypothetical protein [Elusimicrobiota bacterium]
MLFKAFCAESAYAGGLTAGLLYALHPAMTNTVSYVFARSGQLSALFLFLSFFLFLKSDNQKNKGLVFYLFSLLSFILALFSKQSAASFPALILLYLLLANSTTNLKRSLKKSFPYFCVLGLWLLIRYISFGAIGDIEGTGMLWNRIDYILIQPLVYLNYLWLIIFPAGISFEHSLLPLNGLGDPLFFIPLIYIAGMIICFIIFLRNLSVQDRKILLFSLGFFILFILPTSSVFPTTAPLEEKRLYFSSAGFFIAAGWALQRFVSGDFYKNFSVKPILRFLFLTYFIFLGLSTMGRNEYFREPEMVWKDVICKYPGHSRAHNNLGSLYLNRGNSLMAAQSLFSALATDSESPAAHANLGILYERYLNDLPSAEKCYQKAVELDRMPVFPLIRLGNMYFANGDDRSALNYYDMALKYDAFSDEAYIYKGYLYLARG